MKEIPLTQGKVAIVDDEDYESLSKYKWFAYKHRLTFYAARNVQVTPGYGNNRLLRMHTFIIGKAPKSLVTDHIDGNGLNNQKSNLRFVTPRQNAQNIHEQKSSKFAGVHKNTKRTNQWETRIWVRDRIVLIGNYSTEEEAAEKYKAYSRVIEIAEKHPIKDCCE